MKFNKPHVGIISDFFSLILFMILPYTENFATHSIYLLHIKLNIKKNLGTYNMLYVQDKLHTVYINLQDITYYVCTRNLNSTIGTIGKWSWNTPLFAI